MADVSIRTATLYNAAAKYGTMIIQLGLTMILSRLIVPEAYGVVAIITVLLGFLNLFADMGLGISIIQHPDIAKEDIERLFGFSNVVGLVLCIVTCIMSYPLSIFFNEPIYYTLCPVVSIVTFLNAINVVPNAILTRDKKFRIIAVRTLISTLISGVIAVILAFLEFGVYALISQSMISALFLFCWNYYQNPLKFRKYNNSEVKQILGRYSLFQVLFNFLNYFTRNLDNLVIGKYFGSADLAYYNKSYFLYLYPNNIFAAVITGVLHPYIRDYRNQYSLLYDKYLQIEKILSLIGIFTMITFFFCSREIVLIMFGDVWEPAANCLKALSICMWTQMMGSVSGSIFLGIERTDQIFKCGIINLILILSAITAGVLYHSVVILSYAVGVAYNVIFLITNYILLCRTIHVGMKFFFRKLIFDGLFAFGFMGVSFVIPDASSNVFVNLIYKLTIIGLAYIGYMFISKQTKLLSLVLGLVKKK